MRSLSLSAFKSFSIIFSLFFLTGIDAKASAKSQKPDLKLSNFTVTPSKLYGGGAVSFSVAVKNTGRASTGYQWIGVLFLIDGKCPDTGCIWAGAWMDFQPKTEITLRPNEEMKWIAQTGKHQIQAIADDQQLIAESSENNNTLSKRVSVDATPIIQPDLSIVDFWTEPVNPISGDSVKIIAKVRNNGAAIAAGTWIGLGYAVRGFQTPNPIFAGNSDGFPANSDITYETGLGTSWLATTGMWELQGFIDDQKIVAEKNEENNKSTRKIAVSPRSPQPTLPAPTPTPIPRPSATPVPTPRLPPSPVPPATKVESFLINPGPRFEAGMLWITNPSSNLAQCYSNIGSHEAGRDGNPSGVCGGGSPCWNGSRWLASDGSCESYYHDGRGGWQPQDKDSTKIPSWSMNKLSGGNGTPQELQYKSRSLGVSDPCILRELGLVFHKWSFPDGQYAFRTNANGSPMKLGQFSKVLVKFRARLDSFFPSKYDTSSNSKQCAGWPAAYVTVDLRVNYVSSAGKHIRGDILGLHLFEIPNSLHGKPVVWSDGCRNNCTLTGGYPGWSQQLSGNEVGIPQLTLGSYQNYELNVKDILHRLSPPPDGYTVDDASFGGLDIYAHVRGADIDFTVHDVDIQGQ